MALTMFLPSALGKVPYRQGNLVGKISARVAAAIIAPVLGATAFGATTAAAIPMAHSPGSPAHSQPMNLIDYSDTAEFGQVGNIAFFRNRQSDVGGTLANPQSFYLNNPLVHPLSSLHGEDRDSAIAALSSPEAQRAIAEVSHDDAVSEWAVAHVDMERDISEDSEDYYVTKHLALLTFSPIGPGHAATHPRQAKVVPGSCGVFKVVDIQTGEVLEHYGHCKLDT